MSASQTMDAQTLKQTLEALLMASDRPLTVDELLAPLAHRDAGVRRGDVQKALDKLAGECEQRGIELKQVASGYRYQTRAQFAEAIAQLWKEKPPRYSRALLETLALIAYRQPITRAEIEEVRGVSVSTYMVRLLEEREWIKTVGHKEVPGRPALYATTREFLDYFNLRKLDELPTLLQLEEVIRSHPELQLKPAADEVQVEAQAEAQTEAQTEVQAEAQTEAQVEVQAEAQTEAQAEEQG